MREVFFCGYQSNKFNVENGNEKARTFIGLRDFGDSITLWRRCLKNNAANYDTTTAIDQEN